MPDRWAVATGNWSSAATWNGGTLPTSADDVFADGFTVTIDQDITVLSIRTTARAGGTAGGGFTAATTRTLNANVISGTTTCLSVTSSANVTINGNVTGGSSTNARGVLSSSASAVVNVAGPPVTGVAITGGTGSNTSGVECSTGASQTINLSNVVLQGGTSANSHAVFLNSSSANVSGSVISINVAAAGSAISISAGNGSIAVSSTVSVTGTGHGLLFASSGNGSMTCSVAPTIGSTGRLVNMTGSGAVNVSAPSISGGSAANRTAITVANGKLRFTGTVNGGTNATAYGIQITGGQLQVVGNVNGGVGPGVAVTGATGQFFIHGNCSGVSTHAVQVTSTHTQSLDRSYVYGSLTGNAGSSGIRNDGAAEIFAFTTSISGTAPTSNTGSGSITQVPITSGSAESVSIYVG